MNNMKFSIASIWALGLWVLFPHGVFYVFGIARVLLLHLEMLLSKKQKMLLRNRKSDVKLLDNIAHFKLFMLPCFREGEKVLCSNSLKKFFLMFKSYTVCSRVSTGNSAFAN